MIILEANNDAPFSKGQGLATKTPGGQFSSPVVVEPSEFCFCFIECDYAEKVFYSLDDDQFKNDKSSFLFTKKRSSDTINFELWKSGSKIADIIDDTYGILYDGFSAKPLYKGYLLDWKKVFNEHGNGSYQFKAQLNVLGADSEYESQDFKLSLFSEIAADKTVKIETWQTGNIIGSEFDFTELLPDGWYSSVRISGKFGQKTPVLEQDNYLNNNYEIEQIQDKIITEYTLSTNYLPAIVANKLFYTDILANKLLISDYNIINHEVYRLVDLVPVEPEDVVYLDKKTTVRYKYKFKERVENNIKTNY